MKHPWFKQYSDGYSRGDELSAWFAVESSILGSVQEKSDAGPKKVCTEVSHPDTVFLTTADDAKVPIIGL